jgi:hypothetical protein
VAGTVFSPMPELYFLPAPDDDLKGPRGCDIGFLLVPQRRSCLSSPFGVLLRSDCPSSAGQGEQLDGSAWRAMRFA